MSWPMKVRCVWRTSPEFSKVTLQRGIDSLGGKWNFFDVHRDVNRNIISTVKPTRWTTVSNLFYFLMTLYMFRTVFPSIIRGSRLYYIQQYLFDKCLLLYVVLNSWWRTERPSESCRVSFQNKTNLIGWCIWLALLQKWFFFFPVKPHPKIDCFLNTMYAMPQRWRVGQAIAMTSWLSQNTWVMLKQDSQCTYQLCTALGRVTTVKR